MAGLLGDVQLISQILLWAAAGLTLATALIHVFAGGVKVVRPLLESPLPSQIKWLSYLMWHLGTISTLFIASGFTAGALSTGHQALAMIATAGAASFVAVAIFVAVKSGLSVRQIPVIPMFSLVSLLGLLGLVT